MTCKCNGYPRQVWFFRALLSEILVGWLVDAERRGRYICRRKIYIPRPRLCFYPFPTRDRARHADKKQLCIGIHESAMPQDSFLTSCNELKYSNLIYVHQHMQLSKFELCADRECFRQLNGEAERKKEIYENVCQQIDWQFLSPDKPRKIINSCLIN